MAILAISRSARIFDRRRGENRSSRLAALSFPAAGPYRGEEAPPATPLFRAAQEVACRGNRRAMGVCTPGQARDLAGRNSGTTTRIFRAIVQDSEPCRRARLTRPEGSTDRADPLLSNALVSRACSTSVNTLGATAVEVAKSGCQFSCDREPQQGALPCCPPR